jgi:uncharacterized protein (TIGR02266 family)
MSAPPPSSPPATPQAREVIWCRHCGCQQHRKGERCPGEVLATGPERHGARLLAETAEGPLVFGTLVAPAGARWRARLLTYPNILWVVRHGGTMKFMAGTAASAERAAIDYLKAHCKARGFKLRKEVPSVVSGNVDHEQQPEVVESNEAQASQRRLQAVRVRYRWEGAMLEAETDDLSECGLFIRTHTPADVGTTIQLRVDMGGFGITLRGVVRWTRPEQEPGRPAGMGLELICPHPRYIHFVRQQEAPDEGPPPEQEPVDPKSYEVEAWEPAD